MAKKENQANEIVENEPVVINKEDIISEEELKENDVTDVNAPEAEVEVKSDTKVEAEVKLRILIGFTDKYTKNDYKINDVISVDAKRAKELLNDKRKLVAKE